MNQIKDGITQSKIDRMYKRKKVVKYLIYPENRKKAIWDLWMTFVLLVTCLVTPLNIAFTDEEDELGILIVDLMVDSLFGIDILVIFNTAFYDQDVELVEDRKEIAKHYLSGWFTVDMLAIIPFDRILHSADFN